VPSKSAEIDLQEVVPMQSFPFGSVAYDAVEPPYPQAKILSAGGGLDGVWLSRAYVDSDGQLTAADSTSGLLRLQSEPELVPLARALLQSDRDEVRFLWVGQQGGWLSVRIYAERDRPGGERATLELRDIEPPFGLTLREIDVLTLLAAGMSNEGIAGRLSVSPRTITKHVENIFGKTAIWTRAGIAGMATDRGLLRLPTPGGADGFPLGTGVVERLAKALDKPSTRPSRQTCRRPIMIGMPLSLSGRGQADAIEMLNGANMAVAEINERGGVLDRELKIVAVDCGVTEANAFARGYSTLIEAEVDAITAGYSGVDPAIQDLVGEFGGPYLHAATMDSVVERVRNDPSSLGNIFQVCASDVNYGPGLARFLRDLEVSGQWTPRNRNIVVLQPFWPGLDIGLPALDRGLGRLGWQIEVVSDLPGDDADWTGAMDRLRRLDPSVVVLASYFVEDSIAFQKAFLRSPISALVYHLYSPSVPTFRQELGAAADGVLWATTTGLYSDRMGTQFVRRYRARYGCMPGQSHASIAYDRVNILAGAWSRVGNSRLFAKVSEDLRETIHRGINGSYFFGTDGQVGLAFPDDTQDPSISQAHLVFQVQNGEQRILSPQPYADARFQKPGWMVE
jgi:branched-chain amino acid transport system substrate-binding protein